MIIRYFREPGRVLKGASLFLDIFGLAGLYYALFITFSRRKKIVKVDSKWARQPMYLRLNSADLLVFRQVFIEREYDIIKEIHSPLETLIDAGANIGLTSAFIATRHPNARIFAIEPNKDNFELLRMNTQGYGTIQCVQGALWNRDESVSIEFPEASEWAFRVSSTQKKRDIEGFRLKTFMDRMKLERISLLKMDIEGAEHEVLSDAATWVDAVDNIVIELHERFRPGCTALFNDVTCDFEIAATGRELTLACRKIAPIFS